MKWLLLAALSTGCMSPGSGGSGGSSAPEPIDEIYSVTARNFAVGTTACTDPGQPTDPAIPFRELASSPAFAGEQAWEWCDSRSMCDPVGTTDWFAPEGDHWQRVSAMVINAPDNGTACDLEFATLAVTATDSGVHVDLLQKSGEGDIDNCTIAQALAMLKDSPDCESVDRYDLAE